MTESSKLWGVAKTRTTPYHPHANGMMERNNKDLGDSLRAQLLEKRQEEWDLLLPQWMRAYRGASHTLQERQPTCWCWVGNYVYQINYNINPPLDKFGPQHEFVIHMRVRLEHADEVLRQQQLEIKQDHHEEPPLFVPGNIVWLQNKRKKWGDNNKLQQKFAEPYQVLEAYSNHT